jgi:hypothetical protein
MRTGFIAIGTAVLAALAVGCGPRLKKVDYSTPEARAEIPPAKMAVQVDPAKLDDTKKLAADGDLKVSGLFYKGAETVDATVKVTLHPKDGATHRSYLVDVESVRGAGAKVQMSDDGTLTVIIPDEEGAAPAFETSNPNIAAAAVELPGATEPSTCYLGKEILETSIRFALCDLGGSKPASLRFLDAQPDAPAPGAPAGEAPATGEAPAGEAAPAAGAAPAAK